MKAFPCYAPPNSTVAQTYGKTREGCNYVAAFDKHGNLTLVSSHGYATVREASAWAALYNGDTTA